MAGEMDLDPQLKDYLQQSNMLQSLENVSDIPVQQLRQSFEKPYRCACSLVLLLCLATVIICKFCNFGVQFGPIPTWCI